MEWMGHVLRLRGEKNSGGGGGEAQRISGDARWEIKTKLGGRFWREAQVTSSGANCCTVSLHAYSLAVSFQEDNL